MTVSKPNQIRSSREEITHVAQTTEPQHIPPSRSHDPANNLKRSDPFQFGSRCLEEGDDVFEFNAWDHVEPDDEYKAYAETQIAKQRESPATEYDVHRFNKEPAKWWNLFYKNNTANFFKNRKWLRMEFPILAQVGLPDAGRKVVLEVGAGAGNTAFPLLANNQNPALMVHACDFSKTAVQVMRESEHYDTKHMVADVWDVAAEGEDSLPPGLSEGSVDVVILIFIFSALAPVEWDRALRNIYRVLKPGGQVLFRDYGRGDLAQVRFKKGKYMGENFYVRGDGTRVYFFDLNELRYMWNEWTPEKGIPLTGENETENENGQKKGGQFDMGAIPAEGSEGTNSGVFKVEHLKTDRRLIVNRQSKIKMYRCWIQGLFTKREETVNGAEKTES